MDLRRHLNYDDPIEVRRRCFLQRFQESFNWRVKFSFLKKNVHTRHASMDIPLAIHRKVFVSFNMLQSNINNFTQMLSMFSLLSLSSIHANLMQKISHKTLGNQHKFKNNNLKFCWWFVWRRSSCSIQNFFKTVHLDRGLSYRAWVRTTCVKTMDSLLTFRAYCNPVDDRILE